MNFFKPFLTLLYFLLILLSCRIDYDLAGGEEDETQPDILMEGMVQIQKDSTGRILLKADRAAFYTGKGETVFDNMKFSDYGEGEIPLREGSAGRAVLYENSDAHLSGGVLIESVKDDIRIEGDSFFWENEPLLLSSPPGEDVSLIQEGEREIKGSGFKGDFYLNELSFDESVQGVVVIGE